MIIHSPDAEYVVTEYDFTFASNHFIQMTVDHRYDTIIFGDEEIEVNFGGEGKERSDDSG
jgi:hypothetical protein